MLTQLVSRLETLYSDENERRRARALVIALLVLSAMSLVYVFALIPVALRGTILTPASVAGGFVLVVLILGGTIGLLFQGRLRAAAWVQAGGFWVLMIVSVIQAGITGASVANALAYVALASLFLGWGEMLALTALYVISLIVIGVMQFMGLPPTPAATSDTLILHGGAAITSLLVTGVTLGALSRQLTSAARDAQARTRSLYALLELGQLANSILNLDDMLGTVVERACQQFGYHHIQVFLIDEPLRQIELRAASGPQGRRLLERGLRLPLDARSPITQVATSGETVLARGPDLLSPASLHSEVLPDTHAELALPIRMSGKMLGVLNVQSTSPQVFSQSEVDTLHMLASQIAIAVENAQTFSSEAALLEATSPIFRATQEIMVASAPNEIVDILRRYVLNDADRISLVQVTSRSESGPSTTVMSVWDREGRELTTPYPAEIVGLVGSQPLVVTDAVQLSPAFDAVRAYMESVLGVASLAIFPLVGREQVAGHLIVAYRQMHTYSPRNIQTIETFASQIAVVLDNMRLVGRLQTSLEEATALYSTSLAMNAAQSLGEVYDTTLTEILNMSQPDRITLLLVGPDPRGEVQYIESVATWNSGRIAQGPMQARYALHDVPILSQFPQTRANLVFNNAPNDQRLDEKARAYYAGQGISSVALIPLSTGTTWLGALVLESQRSDGFTSNQARLCRNIADQAALAIDLHMLLSRSQQTAERERRVREFVDRLRAATDIETIAYILDEELPRALGKAPEIFRRAWAGERHLLTPEEWNLVENIRGQARLAISNIELLERTQQSMMQGQTISDITAQLQRATAVEDVMETAVRALQSVLGNYDIRLRLTMAEQGTTPPPSDDGEDGSSE